MKPIAVILSGCGVFDGSEIHESVLTLLSLSRAGVAYQCFAPDRDQRHVVNHLTGEVAEGEQRNILVESARIARGEIQPLSALVVDDFAAVILPGGFGAAKNLCDFAVAGAGCEVEEDVMAACRAFTAAGKPSGFLCIAPIMLPKLYGEGVKGTIGTDAGTAEAFTQMGGAHQDCLVTDIVVDEVHQVVSSPAYMLAGNIAEAAEGIDKLVQQVVAMCQR
ncbi:isoprenoid biosynthesis glyoxalase ElbB [Ferrimonas balearica]|uniref:isoprenoid biosynthesis glyoxalase ElbB n=1 Tax=Ferrimonas balearica TaxID=44012 RepID=UPI001C5639A0|nr:isoprenoid biosynthesis glyoxalase ElbB [Ferrimonas balearica]MBW3141378.1 isoprenoid biosynthesis glyoxalase ElbB [Ferrimonas balearica]MBY6019524.1 isoprenoid biosynthesis glyoxalase ElbB [Halomonas denitrificans]MBY6096589.1 isoprenoid biosynthesis glyoxalase ElbB [Ferrimonas balearica]MBY6108422.1 isoprenoid biosynthesis glyoxalase ElbB [Ferrimonas balearica]